MVRAAGFVAMALLASCGSSGTEDAGAMDGALCGRDCDDRVFCNGVERCAPGEAMADEDGCLVGSAPCPTGECDEVAARCSTIDCTEPDSDGDGDPSEACGGTDCDDSDPGRAGTLDEVCDAADVDEDCDATTQAAPGGEGDLDGDGSAIARCCNLDLDGARVCGGDCDDARADVGEHANEACNGFDDDCDGEVDEAMLVRFGPDADRDRHGVAEDVVMACFAPPGLAQIGVHDCDDTEAEVHSNRVDLCDGVDDDCDGTVDEGCSCAGDDTSACFVVQCEGEVRRCEDGRFERCEVAVDEECNGVDDDCDNGVDEGFEIVRCFRDEDDDGFAPSVDDVSRLYGTLPTAVSFVRCASDGCPRAPLPGIAGSTARVPYGDDVDCDDSVATTYPGAEELCNGVNDDCDDAIDEGC